MEIDRERAKYLQYEFECFVRIGLDAGARRDAIDRIRQSEEILNQTLDAEAKAHQTAARSAITNSITGWNSSITASPRRNSRWSAPMSSASAAGR